MRSHESTLGFSYPISKIRGSNELTSNLFTPQRPNYPSPFLLPLVSKPELILFFFYMLFLKFNIIFPRLLLVQRIARCILLRTLPVLLVISSTNTPAPFSIWTFTRQNENLLISNSICPMPTKVMITNSPECMTLTGRELTHSLS